jgi:hypothetical protein
MTQTDSKILDANVVSIKIIPTRQNEDSSFEHQDESDEDTSHWLVCAVDKDGNHELKRKYETFGYGDDARVSATLHALNLAKAFGVTLEPIPE